MRNLQPPLAVLPPEAVGAGAAAMRRYPGAMRAWLAVGLLTVAYTLSLLDRWVLTLLVVPIKAALQVSDTTMGLLMGPLFALVYVFLGLPAGWVADRSNRRNLAAVAIAFWCLMTVLSGFTASFATLAMCRFGIGFGEAALTPAATSMISDLFPRRRVNSAIGVFNLGVFSGMGLSYIIGGVLLGWATTRGIHVFRGALQPWQIVFVLVGAPGFVVAALLMIAVREPARPAAHTASQASLRNCLAFVRRHRRAFVPLAVGMGAVSLSGYAFSWLPTLFLRVWGWPAPRFSAVYGIILLVFGPSGAFIGGIIANRLYRAGQRDAPYRVALISLVPLALIGGTAGLWPSPYEAFTALAIAAFCSAMATSAGVSAAVFGTPAPYRGRVLALYTMTNSLIGTTLGPVGVGYLSDHVFVARDGIRYAMAAVLLIIGGLLTAYLATGRRAYAAAVAELEAEELLDVRAC
jgi:MFS family permease